PAVRLAIVRTDEATRRCEPLVPGGFVPVILDDPVSIAVLAGAAIPRTKIGAYAKALDLCRQMFHEDGRGSHLHQRCTAPGEQFDDIECGSRFGFLSRHRIGGATTSGLSIGETRGKKLWVAMITCKPPVGAHL